MTKSILEDLLERAKKAENRKITVSYNELVSLHSEYLDQFNQGSNIGHFHWNLSIRHYLLEVISKAKSILDVKHTIEKEIKELKEKHKSHVKEWLEK